MNATDAILAETKQKKKDLATDIKDDIVQKLRDPQLKKEDKVQLLMSYSDKLQKWVNVYKLICNFIL